VQTLGLSKKCQKNLQLFTAARHRHLQCIQKQTLIDNIIIFTTGNYFLKITIGSLKLFFHIYITSQLEPGAAREIFIAFFVKQSFFSCICLDFGVWGTLGSSWQGHICVKNLP